MLAGRVWRWALWASRAIIGLALLGTAAFVLVTLDVRPPDGAEGAMLFQASRIHEGLPLYIDPVKGAFDYGPVPARYFVQYSPMWPLLLAWVPPAALVPIGRAIA